ncbi:hypothetical protein [Sphingobacterium pedocola]|uniref:HEPN domain-containing protein n=1 Tax=Sphingobacterium pedocola TaxID=2082722 RepID=A0ABR9TA81_9SPHI|nr:hypothetical protein [Sphingobacterium pedocola]MBE8722233.1 hypothetical protein [Sphingobacterium pedocola]
MGHTISNVNGSYHENPVNNVANHHNENQNTTNHIYLHPGHHSGEFENCMRKVGGLLQIDREYSQLKPLLEMLVAVTEPERLFFHTLPSIDAHELKSCHEIKLVFREERIENVSSLEGFTSVSSFKHANVMITVQSNRDYEEDSNDWTNEDVLCLREEFLVYSNSPYRLKQYAYDQVKYSYDNVLKIFNKNYEDAINAFNFSKSLLGKGAHFQSYWILVRVVEQIYNAIIYPFDNTFHVGLKLQDLKKKAAKYLPQLFSFDYDLYDVEQLSEVLVENEFKLGSICGTYDHTLDIVEEFITVVKSCFESKLNYLLNYGILADSDLPKR